MSIEWFLYLADFVDNVNSSFGVIFWIFFIGLSIIWSVIGIRFLSADSDYDRSKEKYPKLTEITKKLIKRVMIPIFIVLTLFPSQRTIYLILGAQAIKSSPLTPKVEAVIEKKLNEYLKDSAK